MKAPSSTYKHWKILAAVRSCARYSLGECPRIFPLPAVNLVPVTDLTVQTSMPASLHATSSVSVGVYIVMVCPWTDHILARNPLLKVEADLS